jgi:hypothetical protein
MGKDVGKFGNIHWSKWISITPFVKGTLKDHIECTEHEGNPQGTTTIIHLKAIDKSMGIRAKGQICYTIQAWNMV